MQKTKSARMIYDTISYSFRSYKSEYNIFSMIWGQINPLSMLRSWVKMAAADFLDESSFCVFNWNTLAASMGLYTMEWGT